MGLPSWLGGKKELPDTIPPNTKRQIERQLGEYSRNARRTSDPPAIQSLLMGVDQPHTELVAAIQRSAGTDRDWYLAKLGEFFRTTEEMLDRYFSTVRTRHDALKARTNESTLKAAELLKSFNPATISRVVQEYDNHLIEIKQAEGDAENLKTELEYISGIWPGGAFTLTTKAGEYSTKLQAWLEKTGKLAEWIHQQHEEAANEKYDKLMKY